jgi:RAT1-interacting protein
MPKRSISSPVSYNSPQDHKRSRLSSPISHTLPFTPVDNAQPKSIPFQQPLPLTTFSYTPLRQLEFTDSALKYFVQPPPNANLNHGYERWIRRPDEKGRIDSLLRAWDKVRGDGRVGGIGVISWRGVMTK